MDLRGEIQGDGTRNKVTECQPTINAHKWVLLLQCQTSGKCDAHMETEHSIEEHGPTSHPDLGLNGSSTTSGLGDLGQIT